VPSILEEMSKSPELLEHISMNLDTIVYSGGDVPLGCGNVVASRIPLINFYGTTEGASLPLVRLAGDTAREDWKFLHIHPDAGVEFRPYTDNIYELFIVREADFEKHQQVFKTFPELQEYQTHDLFVPHSSKPNRWSHYGRSDDVIVLANGEKTYPVPNEQHILSSHRELSGAIIAGSQRFQTSLLLELADKEELTPAGRTNLMEKIWPSVEETNRACPAHAWIAKSHVLFVPPDRPMIRTPKGTIMRAASLKQYVEELNALYARADQLLIDSSAASAQRVDPHDYESVLVYLRYTFSGLTGLSFQDKDNFFIHGMDSLQALLLTRTLKRDFGLPNLTPNYIYENPSLMSLARALQQASREVQDAESLPSSDKTRERVIEAMYTEYCSLIDRIPSPQHIHTSFPTLDGGSILLTGSTGGLGSHILQHLLTATTAAHIYCLNRSTDSKSLQVKRNKIRGLLTEFQDNRITFLSADLSKSKLGLKDEVYASLLKSVTHIIHNAWPVNFQINISSFQPSILGVVNLVDFASEASQSPFLLYISSVSATSNFTSGNDSANRIPEGIINDFSAPLAMGYGESKYISERILDYATRRLQLHVNIARVGQISGPIRGPAIWSKDEWFPSLIISSSFLGAVPDSLGMDLSRIDWIPVDVLAEILLELCQIPPHNGKTDGASVFNLLNLHQTRWEELLPGVIKTLSSGRHAKTNIEKVSFDSWTKKVEEEADRQYNGSIEENEAKKMNFDRLVRVNPAIKLLQFYKAEGMRQRYNEWETGRVQEHSQRLRSLGKVESTWMDRWVRGWLSDD
jgi:thioester reductase-like protein